MSAVSAFGGGPLVGTNLVRFIYMDEAGTSHAEPHAVVAGVFVHADQQLIPLEQALQEIADKHLPVGDAPDFVFHCKDIWSGTGYFKDRERWPMEARFRILDDLADIPYNIELPITWGFSPRAQTTERLKLEGRKLSTVDEAIHGVAFAGALFTAENYMRKLFPGEVAQLVVENDPKMKARLHALHDALRRGNIDHGVDTDLLPLKSIRGSILFAEKKDSAPLQVADMCAFFIRGTLKKQRGAERFFDRFKALRVVRHKDEPDLEAPLWPFGPTATALALSIGNKK